MMIRFFAVVALLSALVAAVPDGFLEEQLIQGPRYMTDLVFADDAHIFVSVKDGLVHVHEDLEGNFDFTREQVALDITDIVCTGTEEGLGGVQVHPNFEENRWIYLYYTFMKHGTCEPEVDDSPVNRLSRFIVNDDFTIDRSSETVFLIRRPWSGISTMVVALSLARTDFYISLWEMEVMDPRRK